jgi:prephenate dehydrogenase
VNDALAPDRRAQVIGTGLLGGSVAGALRNAGWHVTGRDVDPAVTERARERGLLDATGTDPAAHLVVVATPVGDLALTVAGALTAHPEAVVTDVGSVKGAVAAAVTDPRFVPGHPMAGSEMDGVEGADPDLFRGAVWVLTPSATGDPAAFATVYGAVVSLGAEVVTLEPDDHDRLVAMVSHVPHLTAATLMSLAADRASDRAMLLRLAAGGFRDMTRIAAGRPGIWPDICAQNAVAIDAVLGDLIEELGEVRRLVALQASGELYQRLDRAQVARKALPSGAAQVESLAEVSVAVPDEPRQILAVARIAGEAAVNLFDIEISHSLEGDRGVIRVVVDAALAQRFATALDAAGLGATVRRLG